MNIKYDEINQIGLGEPFICLFSGGKDSGLALSIAAEHGKAMAVILSADTNNNISFYHRQSIEVVEKQAKVMGLPLELIDSPPRSALFAYKLVRIMKKYAAMGVKTLIAGTTHDMEAVELCQNICSITGYVFRCPLWQVAHKDIICKIEEKKIKTIITLVDEKKLSLNWLGRCYDRFAYESFVKMGIHPLGEWGEFHTTLIDMDIFKHPIQYKCIYREGNTIEIKIDV